MSQLAGLSRASNAPEPQYRRPENTTTGLSEQTIGSKVQPKDLEQNSWLGPNFEELDEAATRAA